jgi:two-component system chemotaxis response regulator CheY
VARILVVDDAIYIRKLVRRVVEGVGHEVVAEASDAAEALAQFAQVRPELAIVDIVLPERDGIELVRQLRSIVSDARVLVYSAYGHEETVRQALDAGALSYVVKSTDPQPLVNAIERALSG